MAATVFDYEKAIAENGIIQNARRRALDILKPTDAQLEHGLELHRDALVCDCFSFLPQVWSEKSVAQVNELRDTEVGAREFSLRSGFIRGAAATHDETAAREYLTALKASGLTCILQNVGEGKTREEDIKRMALFRGASSFFTNDLLWGGWPDQVQTAKAEGRCCIFGSVNGPPMPGAMVDPDEEFGWLDTWHQLGVRMMHLTYNRRNFVGDGCMEDANAGLSVFGKELIGELNRAGIIVDVSHSGKQTSLEAAQVSSKPMVTSHSGCCGVHEHPRHKTDETLKAIAEGDGLLGVFAVGGFLAPDGTIASMLDHIDYAVKLIGADHVGIGTDVAYSGDPPSPVRGYAGARWNGVWWGAWKPGILGNGGDEASRGSLMWTNWPLYTVGLVTRGHSDDDIRKIIGGNMLRVLQANVPEDLVRV